VPSSRFVQTLENPEMSQNLKLEIFRFRKTLIQTRVIVIPGKDLAFGHRSS